MEKFLKRIPKWSSFKAIGSSKVIKTSYWWLFVVPLIAKLLEATSNTLIFNIQGEDIKFTLSLPFSWSMFYFSAVAFSIASITYLVYCPIGLQKYDHYEDWKKSGKDATSLITAFLHVYRNDYKMWPHVISDKAKNYFLKHFLEFEGDPNSITKENGTPSSLLKKGIPEGSEKAVYYYVTDTMNSSRALARLIMSLFYCVGFVFFFIVLGQNFIYVCKHL